MRKVFAFLMIFAFVTPVFGQDRIRLRTGQTIEGEVIRQDDAVVQMDVMGIPLTYWAEDIEYLEFSDGTRVTLGEEAPLEVSEGGWAQAPVLETPKIAEEVPEEPLAEPVFAEKTQVFDARRGPLRIDVEEKVLEDAAKTYAAKVLPNLETGNPALECGLPASMFSLSAGAVPLIVIAIVFLLSLASYAYISYCLQLVAQKTDTPNSWFAWVPIMSFILLFDIAEKPRYWAFSLFLSLVPFLGGLLMLAVSCFIFWEICLRRNKPGWVAILLLLPVVQFFAWGYLAFSD